MRDFQKICLNTENYENNLVWKHLDQNDDDFKLKNRNINDGERERTETIWINQCEQDNQNKQTR